MKETTNPAASLEQIQKNCGIENIKFISEPFDSYKEKGVYQEYTMVQENAPSVVKPSVAAMKKTVKWLLD